MRIKRGLVLDLPDDAKIQALRQYVWLLIPSQGSSGYVTNSLFQGCILFKTVNESYYLLSLWLAGPPCSLVASTRGAGRTITPPFIHRDMIAATRTHLAHTNLFSNRMSFRLSASRGAD